MLPGLVERLVDFQTVKRHSTKNEGDFNSCGFHWIVRLDNRSKFKFNNRFE